MRLRLEAEPDELLAKGDTLVEALSCALAPAHPDLADRLHKATVPPDVTLPFPVVQQLRVRFREAYERQMAAMVKDIGRVLDQSTREVVKSESWDEGKHPRASDGKFGGGDHMMRLGTRSQLQYPAHGPSPVVTTGTLATTTTAEKDALKTYASDAGFEAINTALRSGTTHPAVAHLDAALNKSFLEVNEGVASLYRGCMKFPEVQAGDTITDPGYVSTSSDLQKALEFSQRERGKPGVLLQLRVPNGHPAIAVDTYVNKPADESEILLPRNSRFRVTAVHVDTEDSPEFPKGTRHIVVEVLP